MSTTKLIPDQVLLLEQDLLEVSPFLSLLLSPFPPLDDTLSLFPLLFRLHSTLSEDYRRRQPRATNTT